MLEISQKKSPTLKIELIFVEIVGVEPTTPCLQSRCSSQLSYTPIRKVAATYSPTWWGSTIGASELNFSVRNGKRWILTAITATICF